ncbi:MAG: FAD-dependent thymidylate synthase [Candidatus Krumholzibacteriota bacterium]|nr:FAD-dependent thymidylate synthase [Candidatus Krumholzibacteriota bacterium]
MKVILAGLNVESDLIKKAETALGAEMTPEVISAAYARISRDPRNVNTLRREARKEIRKARRSNEAIVFDMGHSSIAEHAVMNFDVMDISRIAVEAIEHFRLASYTEKSQRYIRLGKDFVIPKEIVEAGLRSEFLSLVESLNWYYEELFSKIARSSSGSGTAKEDARYLMPLATSAQLGMTINARELEYMISRLSCHELSEVREFSDRLSKIAHRKVPSLVRYPGATDYFRMMPVVKREAGRIARVKRKDQSERVRLVDATENGDIKLIGSIIYSGGQSSYAESMEAAKRMKSKNRSEIVASVMKEIESYNGVWREFENIDMTFEVVVSASCYAQLKRHRMTTQIVQPYSTSLGVSIPESVRKAGGISLFREGIKKSEGLYRKLREKAGISAEYVLTNAHRRRVMVKINLRELYHFSRLRSDAHAQWEIREISEMMCSLARERFPLGGSMLGGKDQFYEIKKKCT